MLSFGEKMLVFGNIIEKIVIVIKRVQEKFRSINSDHKISIKQKIPTTNIIRSNQESKINSC